MNSHKKLKLSLRAPGLFPGRGNLSMDMKDCFGGQKDHGSQATVTLLAMTVHTGEEKGRHFIKFLPV